MKGLHKYYLFPILYIVGLLSMELYPNVLSVLVWLGSTLACLILILRVPFKKTELRTKVILIGLLCIPILDIAFDITFKIRNQIKGDIVFSAIDKSFATTKSITIREKNGKLFGVYESSVAGFGDSEKAFVQINNDSVLQINLIEREYSEQLTYNKLDNTLRNQEKNLTYRILENKILK
ncbi:MAG: hypothetical protein U1C58_02845 [Flavobacteriaceae bacterium]|nr:hypothetical protein [Flavobacteriaceae bacterium]